MFEKPLISRLQAIFGIDKVTLDEPSKGAPEQGCLFVDIEQAVTRVTNGFATAKVTGSIRIFTNSEKVPFGFFNRRINTADPRDVKDFFFYNIDQNEKYFGNLVVRQLDFVWFYKTQYDPATGAITSINFGEVQK